MPNRTEDPVDLLLRALADGTRRALLDRLRDQPGLTLTALLEGFPQTRQALSKHLALLEDAELVVPVWRGRDKHHYLNPAPLEALPARWVMRSAQQAQAASAALREAVAAAPDGMAQAHRAAPPRGKAPAGDAVAAALLQPPSPLLQGQPVLNAAALQAACAYLAGTAAAVRALLRALPADAGGQAPPGGGFALAEHLWHLADIETLGWRLRFERILVETKPSLPGVDGDRLARESRYLERPWRPAARRFVAERRQTLALLARFDDAVLRRPVVFAGARTRAGGVLAACVAHDLDHRPAMAERWAAWQARNSV
ncbi:MAG: DinB family protein [Rubrivivax sp.]|nr:DinB family protein [Rubrivivax sp.]